MGTYERSVGLLMLLSICACIQATRARCPPPSWIKPTRTCISDKECYPGLCCPDYQGRKSCALSQSQRSGRSIAKKVKAGHCPPPSWIKPTRTCISDKECYPGLCCPDYLGRKSCALAQSGHRTNVDIRMKYCNGMKCERRHKIVNHNHHNPAPNVILIKLRAAFTFRRQ